MIFYFPAVVFVGMMFSQGSAEDVNLELFRAQMLEFIKTEQETQNGRNAPLDCDSAALSKCRYDNHPYGDILDYFECDYHEQIALANIKCLEDICHLTCPNDYATFQEEVDDQEYYAKNSYGIICDFGDACGMLGHAPVPSPPTPAPVTPTVSIDFDYEYIPFLDICSPGLEANLYSQYCKAPEPLQSQGTCYNLIRGLSYVWNCQVDLCNAPCEENRAYYAAKIKYFEDIFSYAHCDFGPVCDVVTGSGLFYTPFPTPGTATNPTSKPTLPVTSNPTVAITSRPTVAFTSNPTRNPTAVITSNPTVAITSNPTDVITSNPTVVVSSNPTKFPTDASGASAVDDNGNNGSGSGSGSDGVVSALVAIIVLLTIGIIAIVVKVYRTPRASAKNEPNENEAKLALDAAPQLSA